VIFDHHAVDMCVNVSHHDVSFICRFWKPPGAGEVLPKFFVDKFVFFFAEKVVVFLAVAEKVLVFYIKLYSVIYVRGWRTMSGCTGPCRNEQCRL
jgi:hypothetical protein